VSDPAAVEPPSTVEPPSVVEPVETHDWIMAEAQRLKALGETAPRLARDPVNQPMINNWLEALGETDPRFTAGEAPPAMAQVWTMYGLDPRRPEGDPLHGTMQMLDRAGFTSVLGTNCEQTYERYLREGERVGITTRLESVVGPKRTGVGEGYFVTTVNSWWVGEGVEPELVATMLFRVLKYKPHKVVEPVETTTGTASTDRSQIIRPVRDRDTEFFWEGTARGELRIQKCNACGLLRHPPGPMCPSCHAADRGHVVASGRGTIFSFLTHQAPLLPGREVPLSIALVELEEGVRVVATVTGAPEQLAIGDAVVVDFDRLDDETTLPTWRVATGSDAGVVEP
jgi:uncharacterized OB-fold protein